MRVKCTAHKDFDEVVQSKAAAEAAFIAHVNSTRGTPWLGKKPVTEMNDSLREFIIIEEED